MTNPTPAFENSSNGSTSPQLMGAQQYQRTLENLLFQGSGFGKTQPVAGFLLRNLHLVTTTKSGLDEVEKDINVEPLYLVMDLAQYPNDYVQKLVVRDIMAKYAARIVGDAELNSPDFKGPGLWTSKKSTFESDYKRDPNTPNLHVPNPEAYRICQITDKPILIPTSWGQPFMVEAGGALAIRESDTQTLIETLQRIQNGELTVQDELLSDENTSRFDVYGMNPGFLEANYNPVTLTPETVSAIQALKQTIQRAPGI